MSQSRENESTLFTVEDVTEEQPSSSKNRKRHRHNHNQSKQKLSSQKPHRPVAQVPFKSGDRLDKKQIYRIAVGLFQEKALCTHVIFKNEAIYPNQDAELARVYKRNGQTYILYYPGKDNELPVKADDTAEPLSLIIQNANEQLKAQIGDEEFGKATKIFLVGERNTYLCMPVSHWVMGMVDGGGNLTIEDSIDRDYDESAICDMIPHRAVKPSIKRGWQNMIVDTWQCAHFVIQAVNRAIDSLALHQTISPTLVKHAQGYYRIGTQSIATYKENVFDKTRKDSNDGNEIDIEFPEEEHGIREEEHGIRLEPTSKKHKQSSKSQPPTDADVLLSKIQSVNLYLKKRAKKSPTDLFFFTVHRGKDYYDRRDSWKKILGTIQTKISHSDKTVDLSEIGQLITDEAKKFKSCFGGGDYYRALMELIKIIIHMPPSLKVNDDFIARIGSYYDMYDGMAEYTQACSQLHQTSNQQNSREVKRHTAAYGTLYAKLNDADKKQFLNEEKEHSAEYRHTFDY